MRFHRGKAYEVTFEGMNVFLPTSRKDGIVVGNSSTFPVVRRCRMRVILGKREFS